MQNFSHLVQEEDFEFWVE